MKRREVIASLGVGVASGCLRLSDPEQSTPTATAPGTETEPDVPTDSTENQRQPSGPADYPTGLSENGVSPLLIDNHLSRLAGETYTRQLTRTNVTDAEIYEDVEVAVGDAFALVHFRSRNTDRYVELAAGDMFREAWRTVSNGVEVYGDLDICCVGSPENLAGAHHLRRIIGSAAFGEPTAADGGFDIAADGVATPNPLLEHYDAEEITELSAAGRVTSEGVISSLTSSVRFTTGGELRQVDGEYSVTEIGTTTVEEPAWVATARERGPQISASRREDDLGVTYTHEGGDPVPGDARVGLHLHVEEAIAETEYSRLEAAFEPGDTLTVYVGEESVGHIRGESLPTDDTVTELPPEGWTDLMLSGGVAPFYKQAFRDI